jgi:hypothetical protein
MPDNKRCNTRARLFANGGFPLGHLHAGKLVGLRARWQALVARREPRATLAQIQTPRQVPHLRDTAMV